MYLSSFCACKCGDAAVSTLSSDPELFYFPLWKISVIALLTAVDRRVNLCIEYSKQSEYC